MQTEAWYYHVMPLLEYTKRGVLCQVVECHLPRSMAKTLSQYGRERIGDVYVFILGDIVVVESGGRNVVGVS